MSCLRRKARSPPQPYMISGSRMPWSFPRALAMMRGSQVKPPSSESRAGRSAGLRDWAVGGVSVLDDFEEVAADGGDEEGGGEGGFGAVGVAVVFDEIKELAGFVADAREEGEVVL